MKAPKLFALATALAAAGCVTPVVAAPWNPNLYPSCFSAGMSDTLKNTIDQLVDNGPTAEGTGEARNKWRDATGMNTLVLYNALGQVVQNSSSPNAKDTLQSIGLSICKAKNIWPDYDTVVIYDPDGKSASTSKGWPVFVYRPMVTDAVGLEGAPPRVILSIPHSQTEDDLHDDLATEAMAYARDGADKLVVRAALISTVHRCHSNAVLDPASPYHGTVDLTECAGEMRASDDAHNASSVYQKMNKEFTRLFQSDQVVEFHGSGSNFAGVSVSNGSGDSYIGQYATDQDTGHAVVRAYDELTGLEGAPGNAGFTICHDYTAIPGHSRPANYFQTEDRKCGTNSATFGEGYMHNIDMNYGAEGRRKFHFVHIEMNGDLNETFNDRSLFVLSLGRIVEAN